MITEFINKLKSFAARTASIESVLLVGSYAKGTNTEYSDVDIVIITEKKQELIDNPSFIENFGQIERLQIEYYGACISIRARYLNGLEAEFGIVEPSWITQPLDVGTLKVLSDGYKIIIDKRHNFKNFNLKPVADTL